jgi:hypothetical protein
MRANDAEIAVGVVLELFVEDDDLLERRDEMEFRP